MELRLLVSKTRRAVLFDASCIGECGEGPHNLLPECGDIAVHDHRTFSGVPVDLGRCDVCGEKRAIYRSREARTDIFEPCYMRLVREWNAAEGVR
ncbi:hypothetical protein DSECCO2_19060 [anaerobic digester metagenome]